MTNIDWDYEAIKNLYDLPFMDLIYKAQTIHREKFSANEIQLSTLLSIKTGSCPEDCAYCPQSAHYKTGVEREPLMAVDKIVAKAQQAKLTGATRFCMGAAWRNLSKRELSNIAEAIKAVKALGMETCVTLGMLTQEQAEVLKQAGLDYYNHNLDTSPEYYKQIITTRTYQDRLDTLENISKAGLKTCCGGIIGMGETRDDRIYFLLQLAELPEPPESVPINRLIAIKGTPLENTPIIDNIEFIRTIAVARIMLPNSVIRLSAGRENMTEEMQTLCFMAGVNSIFIGDILLTARNAKNDQDLLMLNKLGIKPQSLPATESLC